MKHRIKLLVTAVTALALLSSCTARKLEIKEYLKYLNDPENGLVKTQYIGGIKISVKYLPTDYLVYMETARSEREWSKQQLDSLKITYQSQRIFLLVLGTDDREGKTQQDVMTANISSYAEYKQRVFEMSFNMQEYVELINDKGEIYTPVLSHYENTQDVSQERKIELVFAPVKSVDELAKTEYYDLKLTDALFSTGITHFRIEQKDISNIPSLLFK